MPAQERSAAVFPGQIQTELSGQEIGSGRFPFKITSENPFQLLSVESGDITARYLKPNEHHRRNHEIFFGHTSSVMWGDEFGNLFSTLTAKGSNGENIRLVRTNRTELDFMVWGLSDSQSLLRRISASRMLREAGVDTEIIEVLFKPDAFPVGKQTYSTNRPENDLSPFESKLLHKVLTNLSGEPTQTELRGTVEAVPSDFQDALGYLNQVDFYVEHRGLLVSESLNDLLLCDSYEEFAKKLSHIFKIVNLAENIKVGRDSTYQKEQFNIDDQSDIEKYFLQYLPKRLAQNLAKIHELGLVHWSVGIGNILVNGGIKDLEYIFGKPWNDQVRNSEYGDVWWDVDRAEETLEYFTNSLIKKGWLKQNEIPPLKDETTVDEMFQRMRNINAFGALVRHQFSSVYHQLRSKYHDITVDYWAFADYPWKYLEHLEFCIYQSNYILDYLDNAPDETALRDDILDFLSYIYDWDIDVTSAENQLDMEEVVDGFITELKESIQAVPNLRKKDVKSLKLKDVSREQQILIYAYRQFIGQDTQGMFEAYIQERIEQKVRQLFEQEALDVRLSYIHKGTAAFRQFNRNLAYLYSLREIERLMPVLKRQGIIELVESAVVEMENEEVAKILT